MEQIPKHLKYTRNHEWVNIEEDIATVGITHFAQGELGDIVFVELECLNETLKKEEVFGSIEAVKTVSDIYMPVSGEVIALNEALENEPELINNDPYESGWIIKIKLDKKEENNNMLSAEEYKKLI